MIWTSSSLALGLPSALSWALAEARALFTDAEALEDEVVVAEAPLRTLRAEAWIDRFRE